MKQANRERGSVIWFTGLSGSGKTTIAHLVEEKLLEAGVPVEILDGDVVRENLSKGLGFSKEDRDTNIRRIAFVAHLLQRNGVFVITAAISPYQSDPRRGPHDDQGLRRGLRRCTARGVRGAGHQGPLRQGTSRRDQGLHRHRRPVRGHPRAPRSICHTDQESPSRSRHRRSSTSSSRASTSSSSPTSLIDLHAHTTVSDGGDSPRELVRKAVDAASGRHRGHRPRQ